MNGKRSVQIKGEEFKFCCAHFVAYPGFRERLHGHNYTVEVEMSGPMHANDGYVIDFGDVKKTIRAICKSLNERIIIPLDSDSLEITVKNTSYFADEKFVTCSQSSMDDEESACPGQVELVFENKAFFSFPKADCALLPIKFSTAENLSQYITMKLEELLRLEIAQRNIESITVRVFERPTQAACYTMCMGRH